MALTPCPFCEHGNPAAAKFCNSCGGTLTLAPCPHCGAVNEVTASACYQCHGQLRGPDVLDEPAPAAEVPAPWFRQRPRLVIGTAFLAAMAGIGYFALRPSSTVDAPAPAIVQTETKARVVPAAAGPVANANTDNASRDAPPVDLRPALAITGVAREPALPPPPTVATPPVARPVQPAKAGKEAERPTGRPQPCTAAVAALGLCTLTPEQKKDASAAATAIIPRPPPPNIRAGSPEPCAEAVAALGLCTSQPTQRKE